MNANPDRDRDADDRPASPYGPQPRGTDEAAGGADSSPHENEATGERKAKADREVRKGRSPDDQVNQTP
jgi:hypothetical protein